MYNVKVRIFKDNQTQVCIYSHKIYKGGRVKENYDLSFLRDIALHTGSDLPDFIVSDIDDITVDTLSFDDVSSSVVKYVRDVPSECSKRAKKRIYDYSRSNSWEWFVTLTFDRSGVDSTNYDICYKKVSNWLHNIRIRAAPDLKYLFVPEYHSDNKHIHFHGLLSNCGNMSFVYSGHKKQGHKIYNLSGWSWGFSTASKVKDTDKVSFYITKYISKDLCVVSSGRQRYLVSQNCNLPKELYFDLDSYNLREFLKDVHNIKYVKTVSGYVSVQYLECDSFDE